MAIKHDTGDRAIWDPTDSDEILEQIEDPKTSYYFPWVLQFIDPAYCSIFIVGLLSNSWMIYYLLKFSPLHIVPKIYLINRALGDLLYVFQMPLYINLANTIGWHFGNFGCQAYIGVMNSQPILPAVFLVHLWLDIFMVHRFPAIAKKWRTPCIATILSLISWTLTIIYVLPFAAPAGVSSGDDKVDHCFMVWHSTSFIIDAMNEFLYRLVCGYIAPLIVILVITVSLRCTHNMCTFGSKKTKEDRTELQEIDSGRSNRKELAGSLRTNVNQGEGNSNDKEKSSANLLYLKLAVIMSALVFLGWLPYWLIKIYSLRMDGGNSRRRQIARAVLLLLECLANTIPAINPLVVILMTTRFHPKKLFGLPFHCLKKFCGVTNG